MGQTIEIFVVVVSAVSVVMWIMFGKWLWTLTGIVKDLCDDVERQENYTKQFTEDICDINATLDYVQDTNKTTAGNVSDLTERVSDLTAQHNRFVALYGKSLEENEGIRHRKPSNRNNDKQNDKI